MSGRLMGTPPRSWDEGAGGAERRAHHPAGDPTAAGVNQWRRTHLPAAERCLVAQQALAARLHAGIAPGFEGRDVVSAGGDVPGGGRPGESVLVGGPPTEDATTAVAMLKVQSGGSVREVPVVIWSMKQRLVEVVGTPSGRKPDTRDVEVSRYLRLGLELVGTGTAVIPWTDTTATPGWRLDVDEAAAVYTVVCPDGGVGVTGRYRLRDPREGRVTAAWLAAVRARAAVLLLTGVIIFDGREPDLADAQHHGSLLRGVAAYTPPSREADSQGGDPPGRRWWRDPRTR